MGSGVFSQAFKIKIKINTPLPLLFPHSHKSKWAVRIRVADSKKHLGYFDSEEAAARKYADAAAALGRPLIGAGGG
jgi:hypothetical protein